MSVNLSVNLSNEKIAEFRAAFELFDKDRDGQIKTKELGTIMRNLGQNPNHELLCKLMKEVDADGGGTIDFNEFLGLMVRTMKESGQKDELIEAFRAFDVAGNNYVTAYELRNLYYNIGEYLTPEDIESLMKEADVDGDGQIDFEEFVNMMMKK